MYTMETKKEQTTEEEDCYMIKITLDSYHKFMYPLDTLQRTHIHTYRNAWKTNLQTVFDFIAIEYLHQAFHTLDISSVEDLASLSQNQVMTHHVFHVFSSLPWSCLYLANNPGLSANDIAQIQKWFRHCLTGKQVEYLEITTKDPTLWCDKYGVCHGIPFRVKKYNTAHWYNPHWYDISHFSYHRRGMGGEYKGYTLDELQDIMKDMNAKGEIGRPLVYQDIKRCEWLSRHPLLTWKHVNTYTHIPWCRRSLLKNPMLSYVHERLKQFGVLDRLFS